MPTVVTLLILMNKTDAIIAFLHSMHMYTI